MDTIVNNAQLWLPMGTMKHEDGHNLKWNKII